jgi:GNAT superfamily N-acetyltransferase
MTIRPATAADARGIAETHLVESAKGRGLGRGLMRAAACCLRDGGCRSVSLWLLKENPAQGFYERFGGRILGRSRM